MGALRKIGRTFGKVLRKVGDIGGKILSPLTQLASTAAPLISAASPALMASGPIGAAVATAAPLAPSVLSTANQVTGITRGVGSAIEKAAR